MISNLIIANHFNKLKEIVIRRGLPITMAAACSISLAGCGPTALEIELQEEVQKLEREIEVKDDLLNSARDTNEYLKRNYLEELALNATLHEQINQADTERDRLQEQNSNLQEEIESLKASISGVSTEDSLTTPEDSHTTPEDTNNQYTTSVFGSDRPACTTATAEMKSKTYDANALWIFDTTKISEDNKKFNLDHEYRTYWLLQYNSFYDEYKMYTFKYFSSFFNNTIDYLGETYDHNFIGGLYAEGDGYIATAGTYTNYYASQSGNSFDVISQCASDVSVDAYCKLNDFLINNNLGEYVKDVYTEADLLEINLLLNASDLDLGNSR